jgi:hypothetical protein
VAGEIEEIRKLLKSEKVKTLKPNECAIVYDEERGLLLGVCNKNGRIEVTLKKKVEEI